MQQYSSIRAFLYPTSSRAKVIKINLASWHALFAKAHTLQLLRASIIRKCNKIRQTDYISKLRSKIKHNLGPPIMGVVLIERQPLCGIIVMPGCSGLIGGVWHGHSFTSLSDMIWVSFYDCLLLLIKHCDCTWYSRKDYNFVFAFDTNNICSKWYMGIQFKKWFKIQWCTNGLEHVPLLNKTT